MPASKAQQRAVAKYMAANYDEIKIRVPTGRKIEIDAYAKQKGLSVNSLVSSLLQREMNMTDEEWKRSDAAAPGEQKTLQP